MGIKSLCRAETPHENLMEIYQDLPAVYAPSRNEWRAWLEANHLTQKAVWLIIYNQSSAVPSVYYPEAVEEALCFGWIDSKPNKRDDESRYQFFSKRKPKSPWSRINKDRIERLTEEGRMAPAGMEAVELAKTTGTWNTLDSVDNLEVPDDLQSALEASPMAKTHWENFPPSSKKIILQWILFAKTPATRQKRIAETVAKAEDNVRANHYRR